MSLYNMLHGTDPLSPLLLSIIDVDSDRVSKFPWPKNEKGEDWFPYDDGETPEGLEYIKTCIENKLWTSGRFRDIHLNEDGTKIIMLTRNGGGNRENYWYLFDIIKHHPNYILDYDDDYDCTYAYIEFSIPDEFKEVCASMATGEELKTVKEKFDNCINYMKKLTPEELKEDPRMGPITKMMENIFKSLKDDIEE